MAKAKFSFDNAKFAKALKKAREARGMTQAGLAGLLGLTTASVSRMETDRQRPSAGDIMFICWTFDIDTDPFMQVDNEVKKTANLLD